MRPTNGCNPGRVFRYRCAQAFIPETQVRWGFGQWRDSFRVILFYLSFISWWLHALSTGSVDWLCVLTYRTDKGIYVFLSSEIPNTQCLSPTRRCNICRCLGGAYRWRLLLCSQFCGLQRRWVVEVEFGTGHHARQTLTAVPTLNISVNSSRAFACGAKYSQTLTDDRGKTPA